MFVDQARIKIKAGDGGDGQSGQVDGDERNRRLCGGALLQ